MTPLRFYFDFTSTFSYIAVQRIDALAARYGRPVDWRVVSLGHVFKAQGITAPPTIPAKFKYLSRDFTRSCAEHELPCRLPAVFPPDVRLARLVFWRLKARDENLSHAFARAVSAATYGRGEPVATPEEIVHACDGRTDIPPGVISAAEIVAAGDDAAAKAALVDALDDAVADGMVGAPFMMLDDEPFWGADRLGSLERALARAAG